MTFFFCLELLERLDFPLLEEAADGDLVVRLMLSLSLLEVLEDVSWECCNESDLSLSRTFAFLGKGVGSGIKSGLESFLGLLAEAVTKMPLFTGNGRGVCELVANVEAPGFGVIGSCLVTTLPEASPGP